MKYDVIIIGSGIGGLVCGCFLAKNRKRVLIIEKNNKPGGYCSSVNRDGFCFDLGIHSLGGCRPGGPMDNIFSGFNLYDKMKLVRSNAVDLVITSKHRVYFEKNSQETIRNLSYAFPRESENLRRFFKFLVGSSTTQLSLKLRNLTFEDWLNSSFRSPDIKVVLSTFAYNLCLPPSRISAVVMAFLFKETILDGGYYPCGGMGKLADAYAEKFVEYGGTLCLSTKVKKIIASPDNTVRGVITETDRCFKSEWVVSNCDPRQTYFNLIGEKFIGRKIYKNIKLLKPTMSAFILLLGLSKKIGKEFKNCSGVWFFPDKSVEQILSRNIRGHFEENAHHFLMVSPSFRDLSLAPPHSESVYLTVLTPSISKSFWQKKRLSMEKNVLRRLSRLIDKIDECVVSRSSITPCDLEEYSSNYRGAVCGWASDLRQVENHRFSQQSVFKNLIFVGHWTASMGGYGGIRHVTYSGLIAANKICNGVSL